MSDVRHIAPPSIDRVRDLAHLSVTKDHPERESKFAIVAPGPVSYTLARLYKTIRGATHGSTRTIGVFHTLPEALQFLGLDA